MTDARSAAWDVRIDLTIRAQSSGDCDAVMNTLLGFAFPPEAVALVMARTADEIDVTTYGGPPASLAGMATTTYLIRCDRFPTPYRTGPRLVQL